MATIGIRLRGLDRTLQEVSGDGYLMRRITGAATRAMIENAEDLLGRAQRDAPVDEGTLRASGSATVFAGGKAVARGGMGAEEPALVEGGGRDRIVGVVGFDTPYALAQHERLDYNHPKGGKAKYLEDNLKEQARRYEDNLRDRAARAAGRK